MYLIIFFFHNFVPEHMINMETFKETKDNPRPEITVKFIKENK